MYTMADAYPIAHLSSSRESRFLDLQKASHMIRDNQATGFRILTKLQFAPQRIQFEIRDDCKKLEEE